MTKVQVPAIGGIRKVIKQNTATSPGTTIAEVGSGTISLSQLAQYITQLQTAQQNNTQGAGDDIYIVVGPGLAGGGSVGVVPIRLTAPIPYFGGEDGADGADGPPGAAGPKGATGNAGATGPAGVGLMGPHGDDGADGEDGRPGPQGNQGPQGLQGSTGPAGVGVQGQTGDDGADGDLGPPGATGPRGATGQNGAQGVAGPALMFTAEDGADGDIGPPGPAGAPATTVRIAALVVLTSSAISVPTATPTIIAFQSVVFDPLGLWSAGNPTRLTVQTAGFYVVTASFQMPNTGTTVGGNFVVNGSIVNEGSFVAVGGAFQTVTPTAILSLNANDYVEFSLAQYSGGTLTTYSGTPTFGIARVG